VTREDTRRIRLLMHLRQGGIGDPRVLGAIERIPREQFVPAAFLDQAYEDTALPIGLGQTISQPTVVGLMTQALQVGDRHKVLEVGTGSGYQAAVLAKLCRRLYTIERHKRLLTAAEAHFAALRLHNIVTCWGDGMKGWPGQAPFDRIVVTAAWPGESPPPVLADQLAVGGVMIVPMGDEKRRQRVVRVVRAETGFSQEELWPVRFVPLLPDVPAEAESPRRAGSGV
jgi:protein-L-isoaspartate(D-aspartate) O-methyltransferase